MKNIKIKKKSIAGFFFYFLYWKLNFLLSFVFKKRLRGHKKVIVFRTGNIGDIACCIPLFYKLNKRFPKTEFYLLTSRGKKYLPGASDFIKEQGYFKDIIEYYPNDKDSVKSMMNRIKYLKPDGILYLPQDGDSLIKHLKFFLWGKTIGIKNIYGGMINFIPFFKHKQNETLEFMNETSRMLLFLDETLSSEEKYYNISKDEIVRLKDILKRYGLTAHGFITHGFITIHPGAKRKTNRWKEENFIELINFLKKKYKIVLTGSKDEIEICNRIKEKTGCIDLSGKLSIKELICLLSFSKILISNDTGPAHLASLVNTPIIMIQSSRDFKNKWRPYGKDVFVLRNDTTCSPCMREECEDLKCLNRINVKDVIKVVDKML